MTTAITKPKHRSAYDWIDSNADTKNLEKKRVGAIFIYSNPGINTSYISLHYCIKDVIFKEKVQDTQLSGVGEGKEKKNDEQDQISIWHRCWNYQTGNLK